MNENIFTNVNRYIAILTDTYRYRKQAIYMDQLNVKIS